MNVLGIGNALVDIMVQLPDDTFLTKHNLPKGSMQLVDKAVSDSIMKAAMQYPTRITSGGSAANTINGLARLGVQTGFLGSLGKDTWGEHFISDFEKNEVIPHINYSSTDSGRAIALVTPDGERTFATYLGAAVELSASHIHEYTFTNYKVVHIEGYLLQNYELIEQSVQQAIANSVHVSLDLASYNVVEQHLDFLKHLIPKKVDILFANEEEAMALTGENPEQAVIAMGEMVPLSIVKTGANGSLVFDRKTVTKIEALPSACLDTTGAGDLYAAGFLYGLIQGEEMKECGRYGSILAGHVIREIGAKINEDSWKNIFTMLYPEMS